MDLSEEIASGARRQASTVAGWYDPQGKRKSKSIGSKSQAAKFARKIEGQLAAGTYEDKSRVKWSDFRSEHERKKLATMHPPSRVSTQAALDVFERVAKPGLVATITTRTIEPHRRQAAGARRAA